MPYEIVKYGSRFFAVLDAGGKLIAVTVYRKGAGEVKRRLEELEEKIRRATVRKGPYFINSNSKGVVQDEEEGPVQNDTINSKEEVQRRERHPNQGHPE